MKPDNEDEYLSEYTRSLKNTRGIPEDFNTWMSDMRGSAVKKQKRRDKRKPETGEQDDTI
jgi:hypothetical protein